MEFTPLERDILKWIADHTKDSALLSQLQNVQAVSREFTGVGSFTTLRVVGDHPLTDSKEIVELDLIESPDLQAGAMAVLFFEEGRVSVLEIKSIDGPFPETLHSWKLCETH